MSVGEQLGEGVCGEDSLWSRIQETFGWLVLLARPTLMKCMVILDDGGEKSPATSARLSTYQGDCNRDGVKVFQLQKNLQQAGIFTMIFKSC